MPVCYNPPNPCVANNLLKNKTFILTQTRLAQFVDAARDARKLLFGAAALALLTAAAIAIAAQMHPDAVTQVVRQELAVPIALTAASGATDWRADC